MKKGKEQPEQLRTGQIQCLPPYFLDTFAQQHREKFLHALKTGGMNIEGYNFTALDLGALPANLEQAEVMDKIQARLNTEEIGNKEIEKISLCLTKAKFFITDYLRLALPKEIVGITEIRSIEDFWKIIKKSEAIKEGKGCGLGPYYCMLLSIMLAEWEHISNDLDSLHDETEFLYESLFHEWIGDHQPFHKIVRNVDKEMDEIAISSGSDWIVGGKSTYRGKTECSVVGKIVREAGYSLPEIIKDGVGIKFEMKTPEDATTLFPLLVNILQKKHKAKDIIFENINCLSAEQAEKLKNILASQGVTFRSEASNGSSSDKFRTAKIRANIQVPRGGAKDGLMVERMLEVQVNLSNNENETGLTQSAVFKRVQKLSIVSRLLGSFPEAYLDLICKEASEASKIDQEKIKQHILQNFLYKLTIKKGKKPRYCSKEHIDRWKGAGIMPKEIHAREVA